MPNNDDQLAQQYQDILNKYASSLTPSVDDKPPEMPVTPEPLTPEPVVSEPVAPMIPPIEPTITDLTPPPIASIPKEELPPVAPDPTLLFSSSVPTPPSVSEPVISAPIETPVEKPPVPPIYFPPEPVAPPSGSNFFKYLFFLSLLVFIGVAVAVVFNLNKNTTDLPVDAAPTPNPVSAKFCEVGDKKYEVGESFPSEDGCNSCSCGSDLMIACTLMACGEPESVLGSSVTNAPVKKVPTKVYKDIKYGYQFECPTSAKYLVEATSVNGNKIPYKQESCTDGESVTTISIYDNTVVHSFGDVETQVSSDKKYIVTLEGDNSEILSSFKFLK